MATPFRLDGKTALITGGASGIGEQTSRIFAEAGAKVIIVDIDETRAAQLASELPDAEYRIFDITDETAVRDGIGSIAKIDILINNAGIYPRQAFLEMTEAQWDEMQQINLKSMFHTLQLVLPQMVSQGRGKVVNISSVTFHVGMAMLSHYVASKGGVIGLTRSVAREMGEHNIHVNCITPGAIKTAAEAKVLSDEQAQEIMALQCVKRRLMPLDIARVCLFLSSEMSDGMTGQVLNVDGGWVMH